MADILGVDPTGRPLRVSDPKTLVICDLCGRPLERSDIQCMATGGPTLFGHHHCVVPLLSRVTELLAETRTVL